MRETKFRLLKDSKIVGYEHHLLVTFREKPDEILIFHSTHGDPRQLEFYNIVLRPDKYISHDKKDQFTGLHDKNGKEIYKGDIVKAFDKNYEVKFSQTESGLRVDYGYPDKHNGPAPHWCEVVGNIHEEESNE